MQRRLIVFAAVFCLLGANARAAEVRVAVAANFAAPFADIVAAFERDTGHRVVTSTGSTGKFYTQIRNGAPFQALLAADDETPARLEREGLGVNGTRFTYAVGRLVLWSASPDLVDDKGAVLRTGTFRRLALANPQLAPYGAAAVETLTRLQLVTRTQARWVQGENIAQTLQFVSTGNAELGFVALSQVWKDGRLGTGSMWRVPESLHAPLRQDAVLLDKTSDAARALLTYLAGATARSIIARYGYDLPRTTP